MLTLAHVNYIQACYDNSNASYHDCSYLSEYVKEMEAKLQEKSAEFIEMQMQRDSDKLQDAANDFQERYVPLVELLSAEDLALVNSVVVTAGAEQDQILALVINILDAYKKIYLSSNLLLPKKLQTLLMLQHSSEETRVQQN